MSEFMSLPGQFPELPDPIDREVHLFAQQLVDCPDLVMRLENEEAEVTAARVSTRQIQEINDDINELFNTLTPPDIMQSRAERGYTVRTDPGAFDDPDF